MDLPVLTTVEIQGERVQVRAAPVSLLAEMSEEKGDGGKIPFELVSRTLARCCSIAESGAPLDLDALSMQSALRLLRIAVGDETPEGSARPDFTQPPASSEPGG